MSGINWQPIETAPKDGRLILVFEPQNPSGSYEPKDGNGVQIAYWTATNSKRLPDGSYVTTDWGWIEPHENYFSFEPTHWAPLPEPPITPSRLLEMDRCLGFTPRSGSRSE